MKAWGHDIIEFGEKEAVCLNGLDIIACQIAEGGAMGYHGGVFLVSSTGDVYFTCLLVPNNYSGNRKHTPRNILEQFFPSLQEFQSGLMGHGVTAPKGYKYAYLGMGNHLLVKDIICEEFNELVMARKEEQPGVILYNLWLDIVCDILAKDRDAAQ